MRAAGGIIAVSLLLGACSQKSAPLEGERVSVFQSAGASAKAGEIKLGDTGGPLAWRRKWRTRIGSAPEGRVLAWPPVVAEGKVFAIDGDLRVSALDITTGERLWRNGDLRSNADISFGDVAFGGGGVYAASDSGEVARINPATGKTEWKRKLDITLKSGISYCGGRVAIVSDENQLIALDAATGETSFSHRSMNEPFMFITGARPLCDNGTIIAGFSNGELHALRADSGKPVYMKSLGSIKAGESATLLNIVARPALAFGGVAAKTLGTGVFLIGADGAQKWRAAGGGAATPAVSGNALFDVSDRVARALSSSGGEAWSQKSKLEGRIFAPMLAGGELILAGEEGEIEAYDAASGSLLRAESPLSGIASDPVRVEGGAIFQNGGSLFFFE